MTDKNFIPVMPNLPRCFCLGFVILILMSAARAGAGVHTYPAPAGMEMSSDFTVSVDGQPSPVYRARIGPADPKRLFQAMDDIAHSAQLFDIAGFTQFDISGPVTITVTCPHDVTLAKVLPTAAGITPTFTGKTITFTVKDPSNLTLDVNGDACHSLHLFANPMETDVPKDGDPNVIYFKPGVHDVGPEGIVVGSGKTLYLAGGVVLRGKGAGHPIVHLKGDHAKLLGRGIIDGTELATSARYMVVVEGKDDLVEGIIIHDSAGWSMPVRRCDHVIIRDVKIFSHRKYGDGIDLCNSSNVLVEGCFVRSLDDCIVVKAFKGDGPVNHVLVQHCVIWNQVAHALSIGAELREPIDDVHFTDCDIIHDTGRDWSMRIYNCDSAVVTNTRFDHIRIEECRHLISLWIGKAQWSKETERGQINGVSFSDITVVGKTPTIELKGFDAHHLVEGVKFDNLTLNGQPMKQAEVKQNEFVHGITVAP
jgi:Glycosyl hydrolases family 28